MARLFAHTDSQVFEFGGWLPSIPLFGGVGLPTYYLVISLTFCAALFWVVRRSDARDLPRTTAMDVSLAVMVGGFIGARLVHIVFEAPDVYWRDPAQIYRVWEGGFVWYGGALLGGLSGWLVLRRKRLKAGPWLDLFAPIAAAGYAAGRLACLFTGCCFGRVCELPSGFSFRYPTQAFAVLWEVAVAFLLLRIEARRTSLAPTSWLREPGAVFVVWIVTHALGRVIMELFRGDDRGPAFGPITISIAISTVLFLIGVGWILRRSTRRS